MTFNRQKYIDLITYILSQCYNKPSFGKTVLCSILYFIDFNYYELYGKLLTKETYIKSKRGIKPEHFKEISEEMIDKNMLFLRKEPYYNRILHKYYLTVIPVCRFSDEELEIINHTITKLNDNNASSITKYAIGDPPIIMAGLNDEIDCRYVFSRRGKYSILKNNK